MKVPRVSRNRALAGRRATERGDSRTAGRRVGGVAEQECAVDICRGTGLVLLQLLLQRAVRRARDGRVLRLRTNADDGVV